MTAESFNARSDKRLKSSITNIDGSDSLNILRNIEPKTYNFIHDSSNKLTSGFIAQDVKNLIQYSVNESINYIPNISEYAFVCSGSIIKLSKKSTYDISMNKTPVKIKFNTHDNKGLIRTIDTIIDDKTFSITKPLLETDLSNGNLFLYGQEVDDFYSINYNAIFTVVTAALKQLDHDHETTKKNISDQNITIENLQKQLDNDHETTKKIISDQNIIIENLQKQIDEINKKING